MREILFRGRTVSESEYMDDGEWITGFYTCFNGEEHRIYTGYSETDCGDHYPDWFNVIPETVEQYTGLTDKHGKKIFEGDIVQYQNLMDFDIQSVVKFGEYLQDGSNGEYNGTKCIGFYVEVDNFTCPDWCDNQPEYFNEYWKYQNILEVARECEIIGNIHDNPELLKGSE